MGLDFASGSVIQIPPSHPFPLVDMGFHRTGGDFLTRSILKTIKEKKSFKISSSYPLDELNLKICLLRNEQNFNEVNHEALYANLLLIHFVHR